MLPIEKNEIVVMLEGWKWVCGDVFLLQLPTIPEFDFK